MKRMIALSAFCLGLTALAAAADPIEGVWRTEPDEGAFAYVTIAPCGDKFCGVITQTFNASGEFVSPNTGRQIVSGMAPVGGRKYEGRVWRPSNDKTYLGKIELQGDRMALRGCIAGGLICAKQDWIKVQ